MPSVRVTISMDERNFRSMRRDYDEAALEEAIHRLLLLDMGNDTYRLAGPERLIPHPQDVNRGRARA